MPVEMNSAENQKDSFPAIAKRAVLWLLFLGPLFYASYGAANWLASLRADVPSAMFAWERSIPFVAWSIVPYWSINAFYVIALFVNETKAGVDRLAGRYLTAQIVAVACFVAFPLIFAFQRPVTNGLPGFLFDVLGGFDMPFNQAPSLHIALLVIIWDHLRRRLGAARFLWHIWCALIGISVLTTWQHHFIDIPTGALLGLFALWLFPETGSLPVAAFRLTSDAKARRLGGCYAAGALLCVGGAWAGSPASVLWLALLWPAVALAIVAFGYLGGGPAVFQKQFEGEASLASRILLWPYRLGARINAWLWTRGLPVAVEVDRDVWLGRFPSAREAKDYDVVLDLTAELVRPAGAGTDWQCVPMLDLIEPGRIDRDLAVFILNAYADRRVLVCCALGFQRSASVVAQWLVESGRAAGDAEARSILAAAGRPVHLHTAEAAA